MIHPIKDALYVCNHSGGKDSQAMYLYLKRIIPPENLIVIHAHLPQVEWAGTIEHIENTIEHELFIVQANKTFFEMVDRRKMFPSAQFRQCTSDLKRDPIKKKAIEISNSRGFKTIINCMGLRAEESPKRAKKEVFTMNKANTNSKRDWYDWLPIHKISTIEVFRIIKDNNQEPHWAYSKGMSRLSCCFCFLASKADLNISAKYNPELLQEYIKREIKYDFTYVMPVKGEKKFLTEIIKED